MTETARQTRNEYKRAYMAKWRAEHRDEVNAYARKWRQANRDKVRAYDERYWTKKAAEAGGE